MLFKIKFNEEIEEKVKNLKILIIFWIAGLTNFILYTIAIHNFHENINITFTVLFIIKFLTNFINFPNKYLILLLNIVGVLFLEYKFSYIFLILSSGFGEIIFLRKSLDFDE